AGAARPGSGHHARERARADAERGAAGPPAPRTQQPGHPRATPATTDHTAGHHPGERPGHHAAPRTAAHADQRARQRDPAVAAGPLVPRAPIARSRPLRLAIPRLHLSAPLEGVRLDRRGRLTMPPTARPRVAGWYERGPSPGERGAAVIVGHRDTRTGPALFLELPSLRRGDLLTITRHDGKRAVFRVDAVRTYPRSHFPDREVYGDPGRPELRLLTCGGAFEPGRGYRANVVVFAHLHDVRSH
ncbi:class F sortase, partial [Streptomyces sp. 796.1]|uniref:class F sortase n=1 Tax=Streptomyces sp. 796.1 TaxID=3163029 RepID=UPI0039C9F27A